MRNYFVTIFIFLACVFSVAGQDAASVELRKTEMKKLEKMAGQWKGSGWSQNAQSKENFTGGELVQKKVDGLAFLVEGKFTNSAGKVIHETMAVMSYDDKRPGYRFNTYLANGMTGEYDLKIFPDRFEWGFQIPSGTIRYTIKLENDVWFEIGEFSRDGKTWFRNFEMKLERVK